MKLQQKHGDIIGGILISVGMATVMTIVMLGAATGFSEEFWNIFFPSWGLSIIVSIPTGFVLTTLVNKFIQIITK